MKLSIALFLILFTTSYATCRRTFQLTDSFCSNVPTTRVDTQAFLGRWFEIFITRGSQTMQLNTCTTINYTLSDGAIDAFQCEFDNFLSRPRCLMDKVIRKPGGGPGSFIQSSITGSSVPFDVVSLQGLKSFGYAAFASFACKSGDPRTPSYVILSRTPFLQKKILKRFMKRLRCLGFPLIPREDFLMTRVKQCQYYFNEGGFDLLNPQDFVNPP